VLAGALYWLRLLRALSAERLEELRGSPSPAHNAKAEALAASGKAKYAKDHVDRYGDTARRWKGGMHVWRWLVIDWLSHPRGRRLSGGCVGM
jgi:hypothetical protein